MAQKPNMNVIGASHSASLAEDFSRRVQSFVSENTKVLGFGLARENAELWNTTNGCSYRAAGVGGAITGFRADLAIIDDPVRSRKDAESETIREDTWNWFQADLLTRLRPGGKIVLVQTRWHEDDLGGRLLETQGDRWRVVCIPATAKEDDPLGRAPGELLWQDDPEYPYGEMLKAARTEAQHNGAMRDWNALYEQDPRPLEGGIFKTAGLSYIDALDTKTVRVVRAWDFAATAQTGTRDPDWSVGVKMAQDEMGRYAVLDVVRFRGDADMVERRLVETAAADGKSVRISLPQDPGQAGKSQVLYMVRKLAGYAVQTSPETGDKATRAMPLSAQWNAGNVLIRRAGWNSSYTEEMRGFPSASKDDQVDASSRAFNTLVAAPNKTMRMEIPWIGR